MIRRTAPIRHVVVVIPAHNESRRINPALDAVDAARSAVAGTVTCSITVVADACGDTTEARARLRLTDPPDLVVAADLRCAGAARRLGAEVGLAAAAAAHPLQAVWLASTDADTIVPADWLERQLAHARSGAAGVAGVVRLLADADTDCRLRSRFDDTYLIRADGSHPHVHAANLGVRADAYRSVGGWRALATGEDHDLWNRLAAQRWPTRSTADVVVATSARRRGRAPAGFAADIMALDTLDTLDALDALDA